MVLCIFVIALIGAFVALTYFMRLVFGESILLWLPVSAVIVLVFDCFFAGLVSLFGLHVPTVLPISLINAFLAAACAFCCYGLRGKRLQVKTTESALPQNRRVLAFDVAALLVLLMFVALCGRLQFGADLDLNFSSTDPGTHYWAARVILDTGGLNGMYFTHYIASLFIEALDPCLPDGYTYRAFIVSELFFLLLSVWVTYSLMRFLVGDDHKLLCLFMVLLCAGGYPLNNLVFGFSYLGAGVTLLLAFTCVQRGMVRSKKRLRWFLAVAVAEMLALYITYSLFVPIAALSAVLFLVARADWWAVKHKALFVGASVAGVVVMVVGIVLVVRSGFAEGLSTPGYSYVELFGSFVLVSPAAIAGLVGMFANRKPSQVDLVAWLGVAAVAATMIALTLYVLGVLSAYYYYKFYFVLWPCAFVCATWGLSSLLRSNHAMFGAYIGVWCAVLALSLTGLDGKISRSHPDLSPAPMSQGLTQIYTFNLAEMRSPKISDAEVELWVAASGFRSSEADYVPLLGTNIDVYWYEAETLQVCSQGSRYYYFWLWDEAERGTQLTERLHEVDYCAVLNGQELPEQAVEYLALGTRVFENEAGYVVCLRS